MQYQKLIAFVLFFGAVLRVQTKESNKKNLCIFQLNWNVLWAKGRTKSLPMNRDNGNSNWNLNYLSLIVMVHSTEKLIKTLLHFARNVEHIAVQRFIRLFTAHDSIGFRLPLCGASSADSVNCDCHSAATIWMARNQQHHHLDTKFESICHASKINSISKR